MLEAQVSRESRAVILKRRAPHRARRLPAIREKVKEDSVVMERRATFFADLGAARQSKGISLEQIAASTKINISLLKALENNDLSRWPKGLFGRSYLRDYLRAVDLPVESTVGEFIRLFPDVDESCAPDVARCDEHEPALLALTFDYDRPDRLRETRRRLGAAVADVMFVVVGSTAVALTLSASFWTASTLIALFYYSFSVALLGHSFGAHWLLHRRSKRWRRTVAPAAASSFGEKVRRLRELSTGINTSAARDLVRVPWHALLLRIRFLR